MATEAMVAQAVSYKEDQRFFVRSAVVIAVVTIACFAQFDIRFVDPFILPLWVHLHALVMVGWLGLFIAQNVLATTNIGLHRKLGTAGILVALTIFVLGWFTAIESFRLDRNPPGTNLAWIFSREAIAITAFFGLVVAGLAARRDTQSHRRLMLGATLIVSINPALARALPGAFAQDPVSGWLILGVEAAALLLMLRHDRKILGAAHPATIWGGAVILVSQVLMIGGGYSIVTGQIVDRLTRG